jgi:hypothetical protein
MMYYILLWCNSRFGLCHFAGCYNVSGPRAFSALGCFLMRSACTAISFFPLFDPLLQLTLLFFSNTVYGPSSFFFGHDGQLLKNKNSVAYFKISSSFAVPS